VRKATVVILNWLNIKKIKSIKIILEAIIKKKNIKTMWGNTVTIYNVLKKNYKAKFLIISILKK
jgi:hypothetical protein